MQTKIRKKQNVSANNLAKIEWLAKVKEIENKHLSYLILRFLKSKKQYSYSAKRIAQIIRPERLEAVVKRELQAINSFPSDYRIFRDYQEIVERSLYQLSKRDDVQKFHLNYVAHYQFIGGKNGLFSNR